jgi:hypothetical protein
MRLDEQHDIGPASQSELGPGASGYAELMQSVELAGPNHQAQTESAQDFYNGIGSSLKDTSEHDPRVSDQFKTLSTLVQLHAQRSSNDVLGQTNSSQNIDPLDEWAVRLSVGEALKQAAVYLLPAGTEADVGPTVLFDTADPGSGVTRSVVQEIESIFEASPDPSEREPSADGRSQAGGNEQALITSVKDVKLFYLWSKSEAGSPIPDRLKMVIWRMPKPSSPADNISSDMPARYELSPANRLSQPLIENSPAPNSPDSMTAAALYQDMARSVGNILKTAEGDPHGLPKLEANIAARTKLVGSNLMGEADYDPAAERALRTTLFDSVFKIGTFIENPDYFPEAYDRTIAEIDNATDVQIDIMTRELEAILSAHSDGRGASYDRNGEHIDSVTKPTEFTDISLEVKHVKPSNGSHHRPKFSVSLVRAHPQTQIVDIPPAH